MPEERLYYIFAAAEDRSKTYYSTLEISGDDARRVRELAGIIGNIRAEADRIVNEEISEGRVQPGLDARTRWDEITSMNGLDRLVRELNDIVYSSNRSTVNFEDVGHAHYGGVGGIIEQAEVGVNVMPREKERARR
ncbi:hypothetical protein H0O01_00555 [Candidatus Micrarchaeota archaeon]|nr:hypothetical protein [Candidatus Micrarchaeota archaeon]